MIKIFLVRHGQTEGITMGRMESRKDSPLTNMGIQEIKSLTRRLQDEEIHYIYTSPSGRAVKTAEIIKEHRECILIQDKHLYEMEIGDWDGQSQQDIQNKDSTSFNQFLHAPESFLSHIATRHNNQSILIVSHTVVLSLMRCSFKKQDIKHVWNTPIFQNGSLSLIYFDEGGYLIELDADISHLQNISII
ncbi:histidine phosphatase family protein [Bacillus wiedmannii]|uniref:histidine phosphatase family protein n=1 Tax=Bacillus wiedmannii TaxID=1890302 RepID=UPI0021D1387B|nr:histidine phosphatase family protein [Bacillus wiedmannii]MCU5684724.1 histidine phosphatase family protein [Bacillus wiedmannii]